MTYKGILNRAALTDEQYKSIERVTMSLSDWEYEKQIADAQNRQSIRVTLEAVEETVVKEFKLDSDALFDIINGVRQELDAKAWMFEGRGPYQWDDDQYREEAGRTFDTIRKVVEEAVKPSRERYDAVLNDFARLQAQVKEGE